MRTTLALLLVGLVAVPNVARGQSGTTWESLQEMPLGTSVHLTLRDGATVNGRLAQVEAGAVVLTIRGRVVSVNGGAPGMSTSPTRPSQHQRVEQAEVANVSILRVAETYRAVAAPEPQKVLHVVRALGSGKAVAVRTVGAPAFKGRIQAIDNDGFTVVRGREKERIAFGDVTDVKAARMPAWVTGVIIGSASAVVFLLQSGLLCDGCR